MDQPQRVLVLLLLLCSSNSFRCGGFAYVARRQLLQTGTGGPPFAGFAKGGDARTVAASRVPILRLLGFCEVCWLAFENDSCQTSSFFGAMFRGHNNNF
jgi:hypothetical protein